MRPSEKAKQIFFDALEKESGEERKRFIQEECAGDATLLHRVEELLQGHQKAGQFLGGEPQDETIRPTAELDDSVSIGPYKIREKIGEGGMGVVYVAEQTEPVQRKVAIKVIKPGMDTKEVIARFEAERQALAFMEHPNIARVLDAGATESGRSYFVMELVRGIPITEYCDQVKATPQERLELFTTVCDAVQHAHQKGIIHRDIKPSNVLVTQVSAKPVVKVIDFGLAKATSGQKLTEKTVYTGFLKLMGTPVYMSPEQAGLSGLDVDTRSDVYSLGILLYELLTGTTPLDKTEIQKQAYDELCRKIREIEAPKPSARISTLKDAERSTIAEQRQVEPGTLRQMLDGDLDVVVLKALEKDRDRRYATPQDLSTDIDRFLNDDPVLAVPPSPAYLARKFLRRHKSAILAAAGILTLLLVATAFSSWQAIRAIRYGIQADTAKQDAIDAKEIAEEAKRDAEKSAEQRRRELYVANMQLACQIWNRPDGNQREIEELLATWIPVDDQPDLREFTWRHQWSLLHQGASQLLMGNTSAGFSEDGNLIAAGKNGIRIWNQSGKLVAHPYENDASMAVLSANGRWAVLTSDNGIQLIDTSSGDVRYEMPGDRFSISSNSRFLACWQSEGEIAVWDLESSPPTSVAPLRPTGFAWRPEQGDLQIAPDGKSYVLKGYPTDWVNNEVSVFWDGQSEPVRIPNGNPLGDWAWSPDGKLFASGNQMGQIRLQHISRPENVIVVGSHGKHITALAFSPDSTTLVSGGADGTIEYWDVGGFKPSDYVRATNRPSPDKNQDASSADAFQLVFADLSPIRTIKAHVDSISSVSLSPGGSEVASTDVAGVTKVWGANRKRSIQLQEETEDLYSGTLGLVSELTDDGVVVRVVYPWGPANGRIEKGDRITGIAEGENATMSSVPDISEKDLYYAVLRGQVGTPVRLQIRRDIGNEIMIVDLRRISRPEAWMKTSRCEFAPSGQTLAVAGVTLGASLLSLQDFATSRMPHYSVSVAYSPNGRLLAMDDQFQIAIWDLQKKKMHGFVETFRSDPSKEVDGASLAFSPDSRFLAAATGRPFWHKRRKSKLYVWDSESLQSVEHTSANAVKASTPLHENDSIIMAVEFTPDGKSLFAADHKGFVRIWDTATWSLKDTLEFPPLTAMDISVDGSLLALGFGNWNDPDQGIILWDLKAGKRQHTLVGRRPFALAFSADGQTLASTTERHEVELWDVTTGMPLRNLKGHPTTVCGASFSKDGTKLATTDFSANLFIRDAQTLEEIDRHPLTLRALFRLGVTQNRERRYAAAEATLRHLLTTQQRTLGDDDPVLAKTRAELEVAIEGQRKIPDRPPPD